MKREFDEVKALGSATAEEWVKGLEANGKEKLADAARWEQWEMSGGLKPLRNARYQEAESSSSHTASMNPQFKAPSMEPGSDGSSHLNNGRAENNDNNLNGSSLHGKSFTFFNFSIYFIFKRYGTFPIILNYLILFQRPNFPDVTELLNYAPNRFPPPPSTIDAAFTQ